MSQWNLVGTPGYKGQASGTITVPADATVLMIAAHASAGGATVAIFGGDAIPIVNGAPPLVLQFNHRLFAASGSGANAQIVFTGTDMAFVHYVRSGHI